MYSTFYKQIADSLLLLPLVALVLFVLVFAALLHRTLGRPKDELERAARLPLGDDEQGGGAP